MSATMTQPADLWTDANREEIDSENREAMEDARAEWEHNEAIRAVAEVGSEMLRLLLAELTATHPRLWPRRKEELDREFANYRDTLDLMTGEAWPLKLPDFLRKCDLVAKGDAGLTDRELQEMVA